MQKENCSPKQLVIDYFDYFRMFINWLFLFKKEPYTVEPGLYFTGDTYNRESPLLVTGNFLATVVLLYRRLKGINARLLIIDTDGINVWCSSGKGKFSAEEIIAKLSQYDKNILSVSEEIEIILPKLSLSGVKLSALRKNKIKPIIGPVYAKQLIRYLKNHPYQDCAESIVHFGFKSRAYTVVPTMLQFSWYVVLMAIPLYIFDVWFKTGFPWPMIPIGISLSFFYPILFPALPGKRFAVKGISLAIIPSLYCLYLLFSKKMVLPLAIFYIAFIFGTSIFLALSYTGNSAVSNYSKVKKEIIYFLPLSVLFYCVALIFYFVSPLLLRFLFFCTENN